ncbi:MAG: glycoside hydrolase family 127 protein [Clostridia bacterium]|nr:glycoside hydrolase family 127 protein [Clostridia bacterium]
MVYNYRNVTVRNGFWKSMEDLNSKVTVNAVYDRFYETGRIDAFRFDWKEGEPNQPHFFWDSDVAKWMEGAAYILSREDRPDLEEKIENIIDLIEKNQCEDGYFNIYFTVVKPEARWSCRDWHELYCAGHLMEAACAYYDVTGRDRFLRLMEKYADYIERVFVKERSAAFTTPGHEEIELALYRMYKTTGKKKYFELCRFFLENRGAEGNTEPDIFGSPYYAQNHLPIREQKEAFGHSVRAVYLYCGMADLALESKDEKLKEACVALFESITNKKMYVTGGIGSAYHGETFTIPYDLPNAGAYAETCASIGLMFFAQRMMALDPENAAKYADAIELEMYNGMLSGISLDGDKFFYENPLEIYFEERSRLNMLTSRERWPITQRPKVFGCSCCPPNLVRLLSSMGNYMYSYDEESGEVYVNQFADSLYENGEVKLSVITDYPYDNKIKISANAPFRVRIPGWCRGFKADADYSVKNGYACFGAGDVEVELDMTPELVASSVNVVRNLGKAALRYGPMIYCAEAKDNVGGVHKLYIDSERVADAKISYSEELCRNVIDCEGYYRVDAESGKLYAPYSLKLEPTNIRMIPYHCFANRGESDMLVYLNVK